MNNNNWKITESHNSGIYGGALEMGNYNMYRSRSPQPTLGATQKIIGYKPIYANVPVYKGWKEMAGNYEIFNGGTIGGKEFDTSKYFMNT